jgi:alpha-L-fucosidase
MRNELKTFMAALAVIMVLTANASDVPTVVPETTAHRNRRMEWFNEARFGMFIHWGVYSVPAGQWQGKPARSGGEWIMETEKIPVSEYEKFAPQFNPVKFNAKEWVGMAKDAGMKYIVITTKHHDGFAMWRSDLSDWGIRSTPFARDPLKELADECHKAGIKLCFYHSIMDWHHPDWRERRAWNDKATGLPDMDRYVAYMKGQLKELLTGYGPIGILWFDGEWEKPWTNERGLDLYNYVRQLQPRIIVNNRVGKGRAGMSGMDKGEGVGDYGTPEQEIPASGFGPGVSWESCMTMNGTWGYRKDDQSWKSAQTLVRNLIDCASKGGNYLLNVGPTSEGVFPDASIERLKEIGAWMRVNSKAIYGTTASPFKQQLSWGRCTQKDGKLYLHVFDWPADGKLRVPLADKKAKAWLLADSRHKLECSLDAGGMVIQLPPTAPDKIATVVVLRASAAAKGM